MRLILILIYILDCSVAVGQNFLTEFNYPDEAGKNIIIQNSLTKGGINYIAPSKENFIYAIFWTRLTNETDNPVELKIQFPADRFQLPNSFDNSVKLLLPINKMTLEKDSLFNYGFTVIEDYLNKNFNQKSSLNKIIQPQETFFLRRCTL